MLSLLNISNIALIDELRVEFGRGLNLLTGETGSGKSIIVDALGILIGGRFTSDLLKTGAQRGFIEGLFSMTPSPPLEAALAAAAVSRCSAHEPDGHGDFSYGRFGSVHGLAKRGKLPPRIQECLGGGLQTVIFAGR